MNTTDSVVETTHSPRAAALKERVYITFTALAVILTMSTHVADLTVAGVATTLVVTVIATLLAVFTADLMAHIAVHQHLPGRTELRAMVAISASALAVLPVPLLVLLGAALSWWSLAAALTTSMWVLAASLILIGFLAIRRVPLPVWQRVLVLGAEALLAAAVIALKLLEH